MMSEQESAMRSDNMSEIPASTPWPFVTAFGLALIFAGLVTSLAVSVVGLVVLLAGAVGWFRNVLPVQEVESGIVVRTLSVASSAGSRKHLVSGQPSCGCRAAIAHRRWTRSVEGFSSVGIHRRVSKPRHHFLVCRLTVCSHTADDAIALHCVLGKLSCSAALDCIDRLDSEAHQSRT